MSNDIILSMQPGRQQQAGACPADIVGFGGAAGAGKTEWILKSAARYYNVRKYVAKIFRRTYPQIAGGGGMWDRTHDTYALLGGVANHGDLIYNFPDYGSSVSFSHLQHEKDKLNHQGKEYAFVGIDEAVQFIWSQIWYLYSRNRSTCGVRPVMYWTFNPDPYHEIKSFLRWWLDDEGRFPDLSKAGVVRWFVRPNDDVILWHDEDVDAFWQFVRDTRKYVDPIFKPTSFSFIPSSIDDNPILLQKDPGYKSKLMSLPYVERQQLLYGDWKTAKAAGMYFKRDWLPISHRVIKDGSIASLVRYWDRAATAPDKPNSDPDYTVGVLMCKTRSDTYQILDMVRMRGTPLDVESTILRTAQSDREIWGNVHIGIEQDPGQAGKYEAARYLKLLAGHSVKAYPVHKDKRTRANPLSAQAEAGNVSLLVGPWNEPLINELEAFPDGNHDDICDSAAGAFNALTSKKSSFAR